MGRSGYSAAHAPGTEAASRVVNNVRRETLNFEFFMVLLSLFNTSTTAHQTQWLINHDGITALVAHCVASSNQAAIRF